MKTARVGYYWDLLRMLTWTEFRLRDQGTWIGFVWTLLHPLFIFLILYGIFTHWMAPRVPNYAAYLLIGIVQWNFFAVATGAGLTSLRRKAGLLANYSFPPIFVVLASVGAVLVSHVMEWAVLLGALLCLGVAPALGWLLLPVVIAAELSLVCGLACLLAALSLDFRDLDRIWGIVLYALFFMTPVFYTFDVIGVSGRRFLELNPMTAIIEATRALLFGGSIPAMKMLAASAAFCAVALLFFPRLSRGAAERV